MRTIVLALALVTLAAGSAAAQTAKKAAPAPVCSAPVWLDAFAGTAGVNIYPQYSFKLEESDVRLTGYGFLELTPKEPNFTNHVNTLAWLKVPQLSVRTETGGRVREWNAPDPAGGPVPPGGFFQIGPQVNLHQMVPLPGVDHLVVSYLPALAGIRPDNWLVAAGTKKLRIAPGLAVTAEGYHRFLPGADYAEYWLLVSADKFKYVAPGAFVLANGRTRYVLLGARFSP